jgi:CRP/FNR family transcriptional regulator
MMFTDASVVANCRNLNPSAVQGAGREDACRASVGLVELANLLGVKLPLERGQEDVTFPVRRLKPGDMLHRVGDRFDAIYVVRSGFLKSISIDSTGAELVLGFPMGGDVIGLDGIDGGQYAADILALDMSSVVVIPFARLARLAREFPAIEALLYSVFGRELARQNSMAWLLGASTADARVAKFLLDLADRLGRLGYSRTAFVLRMTRQDLGSYLGMKLETVSRMFSAFAAAGLLAVDGKSITLIDVESMREIAGGHGQERGRRRRHDEEPAVNVSRRAAPALSLVAA